MWSALRCGFSLIRSKVPAVKTRHTKTSLSPFLRKGKLFQQWAKQPWFNNSISAVVGIGTSPKMTSLRLHQRFIHISDLLSSLVRLVTQKHATPHDLAMPHAFVRRLFNYATLETSANIYSSWLFAPSSRQRALPHGPPDNCCKYILNNEDICRTYISKSAELLMFPNNNSNFAKTSPRVRSLVFTIRLMKREYQPTSSWWSNSLTTHRPTWVQKFIGHQLIASRERSLFGLSNSFWYIGFISI